ncbi:MAG: hypothetical protein B7Y53_03020, partial [Halothiobacillus sp. 28-55-5]
MGYVKFGRIWPITSIPDQFMIQFLCIQINYIGVQMIFKNNIQARFVVPVSAFVILMVLGGAVALSLIEQKRITADVNLDVQNKM